MRRSSSRSATSGSSPLARGLRPPTSTWPVAPRIIPARAGFTCLYAALKTCGRDHPRSRGVYGSTSSGAPGYWGSSPLARGLRGKRTPPTRTVRIIPARAGFTRRAGRRLARLPDHPRSRGVYWRAQWCWPPPWGSSPLARGLPRRRPRRFRARRIIPARAGFTTRAGGRRLAAGDHPRSRGVYGSARSTASPSTGSSPLARGLPAPGWCPRGSRRIIPARAGFTDHAGRPTYTIRDHPRSRGVYRVRSISRGIWLGSSPLARGLLSGLGPVELSRGIIPARAGFTVCVTHSN